MGKESKIEVAVEADTFKKPKMNDDVQGEGKAIWNVTNPNDANIRNKQKQLDLDQPEQEEDFSSLKLQKTNICLMGGGINAAATEARRSSLKFFKPSSVINNSTLSRDDIDIVDIDNNSTKIKNSINSGSNHELEGAGLPNSEIKVNQGFQILQKPDTKTLLHNSNALATKSFNSETSDTTPQPNAFSKVGNKSCLSEFFWNSLIGYASIDDDYDYGPNKVRYHPDDKENFDCNGMIPKKKIKLQLGEERPTARPTIISDSDSTDTEFEEEEEEDIDVKITLLPSPALNNDLTIMTQEDLGVQKQMYEELEKELELEFLPENNVECVLDKRSANDECSYMLYYVDKAGRYYEPEDFI